MAMDGINITEDTEMADCEADKVVTMVDVLQEQQDFEEDANAVLGASDANNCTYSQGYIKRQAIYACLTCCPESKTDPDKRAGVCLACSLNCHENHDLVELYTKRNFRCDCGNPKFNSNPCQFITNKDDLNSNNMYNHNFSGLYCTCKRPYPDPEATVDEDMIQCIICEDWLHASHLNAVIPPSDQYSEMICRGCMDRNEFLHDYCSLAVNNESIEVDVITINVDKDPVLCNGDATNEAAMNSESDINSGMLNGVDVDMVENNIHPNKTIVDVPALKENSINIEQDAEMEDDSLKETTDNESEDKITNEEETSKTTEASIEPAIEEQKEPIDKTDNKLLKNQLELNEETVDNDVKTDSESSVVVTETPQETVDKDSADAVMDAINELLDDPEDITNKNKDNNDLACKESTNNKDNTNNTNVPEIEIQSAIDNETLSTDTEMTDNKSIDHNKSIEEQADTDSDKKDSIPTADGSAETDKEQLETPDESENSAPASDDNDKLNSDVEIKKSREEQADTDSDTKDSIPTADGSAETDKQLEPLNESENSAPASYDNDKLNSDVEIKKSREEQADTDSDTKDSIPTANGSAETDKQLEPLNESENSASASDENDKLNSDVEIKKSREEQADTDSDKKDSIPTADGSAETGKEELETPNESENSAPASDDNDELNSDVEMVNNKITEELNASEKSDPLPNVDDNNTTVSDTEKTNNADNNEQLDTTINSEKKQCSGMNSVESGATDENNQTSVINNTKEVTDSTNEHKRKLSTDMPEETCKKAKLNIDKCTRPKGVKKVFKGATFWPPNFRQLLCTCGECISMYKDLQVLFLTDFEDTVSYYESLGKQKLDAGASQYERGLEALSSLDRMHQINALTEYNNMRDRLLDFLTRFKDRQEVVKEEDIRAFFAGMKPRREPDGVYFCR